MPTEQPPPDEASPAAVDPVPRALAELRHELPRRRDEAADRYWLRVGVLLGLHEPDRARRLLEQLDPDTGPTAPGGGAEAAPSEADAAPSEAEAAPSEAEAEPSEAPVRSLLLARSASLPLDRDSGIDPEAMFGWAARVTREEALRMGRLVDDMLAAGASPNLVRGFGITWRAGVELPDQDFDSLFRAFTELELTVCGVLAGYDLRAAPRTPPPSRLTSVLRTLLPPTDERAAEAGAILDRAGPPGQRGLLAMWNAWAAMRFRSAVPAALFEQLARPWVTVVGPLPEP